MKTKIILQLFLTLLLGFVIGFMSHGYITSQKIKNYSWGRGESKFWNRAMDELEVTPEQRQKIIPLVKEYSEKGHKLMQANFNKIEPVWDEMNEKIMPILSKEQQLKLVKLKEERSKRFHERMKNPGQKGSKEHGQRNDSESNPDKRGKDGR